METFKVAVGAPGNWDTCVPEVGKRAGIFKKHGLELEILYTQGGGETMQAVISGSVDIGIAAGTLGVLGAYAKGAPVRIIGRHDRHRRLFWYVPAASPIKTLQGHRRQDRRLFHQRRLDPHDAARADQNIRRRGKPVATGAAAVTLTQVMSGQIDVGWASPPFGIDAAAGRARSGSSRAAAMRPRRATRRCACTSSTPTCWRSARTSSQRFMRRVSRGARYLYDDPEGVEHLRRIRQDRRRAGRAHPRGVHAQGGR